MSSPIELPGIIETTSNEEPDIKIIIGKVNPPSLEGKTKYSTNLEVDYEDIYIWWEKIGKVKISNSDQIIVDVRK